MSQVIKFIDEELGPIFIEVEKIDGGEDWTPISKGKKGVPEVEGKFSQALSSLKAFASGTFRALKDMKPDEIQIKGGVKFKVKEGVLISWFAQASGEFPFEVTMKWKLNKDGNELTEDNK